MDPVFLSLSEVLEIHRDQIERYGGRPGVRDMKLLQSAIGVPAGCAGDDFFHEDFFLMAAAYLFHITRNHPFVDGNKRVGIVAALVFLSLNDIEIDADENELEKIVMKTAEGKTTKSEIAEFFKRNSYTEG